MEEKKEDLFEFDSANNTAPTKNSVPADLSDRKGNASSFPTKTPVKLTNKKTSNAAILPEEEPKAEPKTVETEIHYTVKPSEHGEARPGHILRDARIKKGLTIEEVSSSTKIVKRYIELIENDDYSSLPSPVFVTAYIKALCELYGIKEKESFILQKLETNQKIRPVPDEILATIHKGRQVNLEAEKKATILFAGIALAFLIAIGTAIFLLLYFKSDVDKKIFRRNTQEVQKNESSFSTETERKANPVLSSEAYQINSEKIKTNFTYPQFITQDELPVIEKTAKK